MTKIQPLLQPIKNITTDFPSTPAELQDFFQVYKASSGLQVKIQLVFKMPGITESALHDSMLNTLKHNNLWLTSDKIAAKRSYDVGFVENRNWDYTHHQETAAKIETAIIKVATKDPMQCWVAHVC